ncbi:MAG TPA: hypothetical protein VMH02_00265 [Verrucomicrobiae bacterium]|nr:hypothetical protein [Verrucomicrobiae bacterium]
MPQEHPTPGLAARVARLAAFMASTDVVRLRIEREDEEVEIARRAAVAQPAPALPELAAAEPRTKELEALRADLVGVFRLGRPAPSEGELLDGDRELGFIEALGIRNPVHSLGAGRIVMIAAADGAAVEYGQALFLLDRG